MSTNVRDAYWSSDQNRGREQLLAALEIETQRAGWTGLFNAEWQLWDILLVGDIWHNLKIHTVTEDLGESRRFTRARCILIPTVLSRVILGLMIVVMLTAVLTLQRDSGLVAAAGIILMLLGRQRSKRQCFDSVAKLFQRCGNRAQLKLVNAEQSGNESEMRVPAGRPATDWYGHAALKIQSDDGEHESQPAWR